MKLLKKAMPIFMSALAVTCSIGTIPVCAEENKEADKNQIVVLYTNDVHNAYVRDEESMGYAAVAAYKKELEAEGHRVILVDGGDAIQGGVIGTLSDGQYIVDIMEEIGYSVAIPGNHEFDFGMENFLSIAEESEYKYISCNFIDLESGETVLEPYEIVEFDDVKVAFVGITTPESFTKSTPAYFQDEEGNYIYGFCQGDNGQELYNQVQDTVDEVRDEVDYVIAIGHAGIDPGSSPWTSEEIIANTTGIDAFLDAHSHSTIPQETPENLNGEEVVLCSSGTKLSALGQLVISEDGTITSSLVDDIEKDDPSTVEFVGGITEKFEDMINEVVAHTEVDLVVNDPVTGERLVRNQETNLGDLCADAYRIVAGADVAFMNGGGIRADIAIGDVTYGDIINVNPFGNAICVVEATGQQILDALEMGASLVGISENGEFLHVSGLTYEVDTTIPSSVETNEIGEFVAVNGDYRVKNVLIAGEPLDVEKTYTLASHNYMLKNGGGGCVMFKECKLVLDEFMLDNEVLIQYIKEELDGKITKDSIYANPYGEGRIKILTEKEEIVTEEITTEEVTDIEETTSEEKEDAADKVISTEQGSESDSSAQTGDGNRTVVYMMLLSMVVFGVFGYREEKTK